MLGLSAFAETTFGATARGCSYLVDTVSILPLLEQRFVTGSGVTISMGTPTYTISGA